MSTYTPIASVTLSSAQSSVTFSGIPQTYTDLVVVVNSSNTPNNAGGIRFNDDSGNNYSLTRLYGTGSSASSDKASNQNHIYLTIGSTTSNQLTTTQISNYANSSVYKTVLMRISAAPADFVAAQTALWRNTNAITSITFFNPTGGTTFNSGSTFNLYGVANASITNVAKATGGDTVVTDGTYWYHVFRSSGTFTPTQSLSCDYLVVAGGASGGNNLGGGGGAGGFRVATSQTLSATNYTVTVGAGGARSAGSLDGGTNGSNSSINSFSASGGGGGMGGGGNNNGGSTGGSGGGKNANSTGTFAGNSGGYTPVEGYAGGSGGSSNGAGGGGGGAGGVGGNGANGGGAGGNGGVGNSSYSSWGSVTNTGQNVGGTYYYAGGGGGGTTGSTGGSGGSGGGGAGGPTVTLGTPGTANTGGGGGAGGGSISDSGGAGGSGIVIVRYSAA